MRRLFLVPLTFSLLLGAGCLGGGSTTTGAGGVWESQDGGSTWTSRSVLPGANGVGSISSATVIALEVDPQDPTAYYIGTSGNGLLMSYDAGATWMRPEEELLRSGAVIAIEVDPTDVCTVYVAKTDRIVKTTTCGRTWNTKSYVESRSDEMLTNMTLDWYNRNQLYATTSAGEVIRSTDGGATWATIYRAEDDISAFAVSNSDSRVLLVGTRRHGLLRSIDAGSSWTSYEDSLQDEFRESDKVYDLAQTADGATLYMSSEYGLIRSTDMGATWSDVPLITARGEVEILAIAVDPNDGQTIVYGTDAALFRSTSSGEAWTTEELPGSGWATALLAIHPEDGNRLILGLRPIED